MASVQPIAEELETLSGSASCSASATLALVRSAEQPAGRLAGREKIVGGIVEVTRGLREQVLADQLGQPLDPDGVLAARLLADETAAAGVLDALRQKPGLESLVEPFVCLAEALRDLRWAIMEHDADLDPVPERGFRSAEELIGHLKGES